MTDYPEGPALMVWSGLAVLAGLADWWLICHRKLTLSGAVRNHGALKVVAVVLACHFCVGKRPKGTASGV